MKLLTTAPRGTQDILPKDTWKIELLENEMKKAAKLCGFREIRTPIFEHTELFLRSVGDDTDIVQKEMYTFEDKGKRSLTLRPEGTSGVVRALLEHGLFNDAMPQKFFYSITCYRYEKPQSGRYREFRQFGVESFGSPLPGADAEVICMAQAVFERLGVKNLELQINSIGCKTCRERYWQALREYFSAHKVSVCGTCLERLAKNPMRALDCKVEKCKEISNGAPKILEFLCEECGEHFGQLQGLLKAAGVNFSINPRTVRGLDYYSRTVFEFVSPDLGSQGTVCGGGRYDGLVAQLSDKDLPAVGFAFGVDRLLLLLEKQGVFPGARPLCEVYIAVLGEKAALKAQKLAQHLRGEGVLVELDLMGRTLAAQLKFATKIGARFCLVLGDKELECGQAQLKNLESGDAVEISLEADFLQEVLAVLG